MAGGNHGKRKNRSRCAGRNLAACLGKMSPRRAVLRWRSLVRSEPWCHAWSCFLRGWLWVVEAGGYTRPDHIDATFRHLSALCLWLYPPLTTSACLWSLAVKCSSLAATCLCACHQLPFVLAGHLAGFSRRSGGTTMAVLRAYGAMPDRLGRLEGAERRRRARSARHLRRNRSF